MAEYCLTPAAERDLENIWLYTRLQWGAKHADSYTKFLRTRSLNWRKHRK